MKKIVFSIMLTLLVLLLAGAIVYNISFRSFLDNNYPEIYQHYFGNDERVIAIPIYWDVFTTYSTEDPYKLIGVNAQQIYGDKIADLIRTESKKEEVKGFVLELDTVGGNFDGSDEIKKAIDEVEKPVISVVRGRALSSGIQISSDSDYVFISPLSDIGDIGTVGAVEFFSRTGKSIICFVPSNKFKVVGLPQCDASLVPLDLYITSRQKAMQEAIAGEKEFTRAIADARGLAFEEVAEISDGKIMTGKEAVERGLADEFGNMNDALKWFEKREGRSLRIEFVGDI